MELQICCGNMDNKILWNADGPLVVAYNITGRCITVQLLNWILFHIAAASTLHQDNGSRSIITATKQDMKYTDASSEPSCRNLL